MSIASGQASAKATRPEATGDGNCPGDAAETKCEPAGARTVVRNSRAVFFMSRPRNIGAIHGSPAPAFRLPSRAMRNSKFKIFTKSDLVAFAFANASRKFANSIVNAICARLPRFGKWNCAKYRAAIKLLFNIKKHLA